MSLNTFGRLYIADEIARMPFPFSFRCLTIFCCLAYSFESGNHRPVVVVCLFFSLRFLFCFLFGVHIAGYGSCNQ